jgi:hypothetical protein
MTRCEICRDKVRFSFLLELFFVVATARSEQLPLTFPELL